jgi:hypothetical protein
MDGISSGINVKGGSGGESGGRRGAALPAQSRRSLAERGSATQALQLDAPQHFLIDLNVPLCNYPRVVAGPHNLVGAARARKPPPNPVRD